MFSLFSPSTANNYAATFRQAEIVPGFENVKEDRFAEMFAKIPLERYKQEMAFAQAALGEEAANKRSKMELDYYRERDAASTRRNKIASILGMAKNIGVSGAGLLVPQKRDAYSSLLSYMQAGDALAQSRAGRMAGSDAGLISAVKGLGADPLMDKESPAIDLSSTVQTAQFTTPLPAPASLQDVTKTLSNMDLMKQFLQLG